MIHQWWRAGVTCLRFAACGRKRGALLVPLPRGRFLSRQRWPVRVSQCLIIPDDSTYTVDLVF
jgi:hypothetical protein